MRTSQKLSGLFAPLVGVAGLAAAVMVNRDWWRVTENAISDMGRVGLRYSYVLNIPIVVTAVLMLYYELGLLAEVGGRIEKVGVGVFAAGIGFLALIGLFPEGTSLHYPVSWAFFMLASAGILIAGVGGCLGGSKAFGAASIAIFVAGWILGAWALTTFKGVAPAELVGISAVLAWHYLGLYVKVLGRRL